MLQLGKSDAANFLARLVAETANGIRRFDSKNTVQMGGVIFCVRRGAGIS